MLFARSATPAISHFGSIVSHGDHPLRALDQRSINHFSFEIDRADAANGALRVLPGSHRGDDLDAAGLRLAEDASVLVAAAEGDVLLMRPRLYHASSRPLAGDNRHRRVLHLECAATSLSDGLQWHTDLPLRD